MPQFTGKTQDATSPILGAELWKKGMRVEGTVARSFETKNGICYEILLNKPMMVNGENQKSVSVGSLKGFEMALSAAGVESLEKSDKVIIECTGTTKTNKGNPRVDFKVGISRED